MCHAGLDEPALVGVGDVLVQHHGELRERRGGALVLADAAAHAHHVGERPVGHALAVGEAAAAVPVDDLGQAVEVLVELPDESRLADPGDPRHRDQVRPPLLCAGVEQALDLAQLAVAADERRLQALGFERAPGARDDPHCPPERVQSRFALELVRAGVLVDDRRLGRAPGRLAREHMAGLRQRLDPRGGVDDVARHHALAVGPDRDGGLAGEHAGPGAQVWHSDLVAQRRDGRDQVERRPHRPLGVVLGGRRRPPHRHHRVADELLDRPAVELDQPPGRVEVARQELAHLVRVTPLRERREPHQVGEQHRHQPPLRHGRDPGLGDGRWRRRAAQRRPALAAELRPRLDRRAAGRAGGREPGPALAAELTPSAVIGAALWTDHARSLRRVAP